MSAKVFLERDPFSPIRYLYPIEKVLFSGHSAYQEIAVVENQHFGRMLILDGVVQLTQRDEYFYHEMLAHVVLHAHPNPAAVLIIGGGDGGTLREVLKHATVRQVTLADIDAQVIEVSKEFFPDLTSGYGDPRVSVVNADGAEHIAKNPGKYDVILIDSTDPVGPAASLITEEFYAGASASLRAQGMLVAQSESLHFHQEFLAQVQTRLAKTFATVELYAVPLVTYAGNWWSFSVGSKGPNPRVMARPVVVPTRFYAEDVHGWAFVPASVRRRLLEA